MHKFYNYTHTKYVGYALLAHCGQFRKLIVVMSYKRWAKSPAFDKGFVEIVETLGARPYRVKKIYPWRPHFAVEIMFPFTVAE